MIKELGGTYYESPVSYASCKYREHKLISYRSEWRSQQKIMRVRCLELQFVATFELIFKTIMANEELVLERIIN